MATTILPAGVLDSSHATDCIIVTGWVLDKPVDPSRVENAWSTLVDAWPLLVARLRKNAQRWEYHVPPTPTVVGSFATLHIDDPIKAHYQYSEPSPTIRCTEKQNPFHLILPHAPQSIAELLASDKPLVHLNVTVFKDASIIGLSVPHILCDGHGVTAIMRALCAIINGGPSPPPLNLIDPYAQYVPTDTNVPAPSGWRILTKFQSLVFFVRIIWNSLFGSPIENREVFFPKEDVLRIKNEAMDDIRQEYGKDTDKYISSSDAVLAFCVKCKYPPTTSTAPLNVFYTANLRRLLALPTPFLHNAVCMVITPTLPLSIVSTLPLSQLALHIRQTLDTQTTKPAAETWLRWRLAHAHGRKAFFDPYRGKWDVVVNWRDMKLMDLDFSGALPESGERVRCVYLWGNGVQPYKIHNWMGIWADDPSGGIWMSGFLSKKVWEDRRGFGRFVVK